MLAEVTFELGHVFNWMLWISGIILWTGLPAIYVLDRLSAGSSISVRSIEDDGYLDPGPSTLTDPSIVPTVTCWMTASRIVRDCSLFIERSANGLALTLVT